VIPFHLIFFLICAEGLSSLLAHDKTTSELAGIKVCREAPMHGVPSPFCI
jgi:hypothetical protein